MSGIDKVSNIMDDVTKLQHRFFLQVHEMCKADIGAAMSVFNINKENAQAFAELSSGDLMGFLEIKVPLLQVRNNKNKNGFSKIIEALRDGDVERINLAATSAIL